MNFENNSPDGRISNLNQVLEGICVLRPEITPIRDRLLKLALDSGVQRVHLYNGEFSFSINQGLLLKRNDVQGLGLYIFLHELYHQYQIWGTDPQSISIARVVEAYLGPSNEDAWSVIQKMEVEAEVWANQKGGELLGDKFKPNYMYSNRRVTDFRLLQTQIQLIAQGRGIDQWDDIAQDAYRYAAQMDRQFPIWW